MELELENAGAVEIVDISRIVEAKRFPPLLLVARLESGTPPLGARGRRPMLAECMDALGPANVWQSMAGGEGSSCMSESRREDIWCSRGFCMAVARECG